MGEIGVIEKRQYCSELKLSEMIDTYEKLIFSICYKVTDDYFAAEDLTQETFITAYQKYEMFDGQNEKAWLCRIATNKSIDYIRSAGRRTIPTEDTFFELSIEKRGSPEDICVEEEIKTRLRETCANLKPPYDEIATDFFVKELNPTEIAMKRNQNIKTIQTQIYRARDLLRKIYGKEETA